jgi:8-oxo-dGTP diphosphatase
MTPERRLRFAAAAISLCRAHAALAVINADLESARRCQADGVHLPAAQLAGATVRPAFAWCGASCHDRAELERAVGLGCDYALLGPVLSTQSHPGAESLGWTRLAELVRGMSLPVYAIGGMRPEHLELAWRCGAHGIAMMRAAWELDSI